MRDANGGNIGTVSRGEEEERTGGDGGGEVKTGLKLKILPTRIFERSGARDGRDDPSLLLMVGATRVVLVFTAIGPTATTTSILVLVLLLDGRSLVFTPRETRVVVPVRAAIILRGGRVLVARKLTEGPRGVEYAATLTAFPAQVFIVDCRVLVPRHMGAGAEGQH